MTASPAIVEFPAGHAPAGGVMGRSLFGRRGASNMTYSLIAAFYDLTGWTDAQIAQLLNMPRSTVQAFRTARVTENLRDDQRDLLIEQARRYRDQVINAVAQMELYS